HCPSLHALSQVPSRSQPRDSSTAPHSPLPFSFPIPEYRPRVLRDTPRAGRSFQASCGSPPLLQTPARRPRRISCARGFQISSAGARPLLSPSAAPHLRRQLQSAERPPRLLLP